MAVNLSAGGRSWDLGSGRELGALFDTIAVRLEPGGRGTRFPALSVELYRGRIPVELVAQARSELAEATAELRELPPDEVVWDAEDPRVGPPFSGELSADVTNLAELFLTGEGELMLEVIGSVLEAAEEEAVEVEIRASAPISKLGVKVGVMYWGIGDTADVERIAAALEARAEPGSPAAGALRTMAADGLEGQAAADLLRDIRALAASLDGEVPSDLRTESGGDVLAILDEALGDAVDLGRPARISHP